MREESQAQSDLRPLPDEGTVEGDTGESVQPHESLEEVSSLVLTLSEDCAYPVAGSCIDYSQTGSMELCSPCSEILVLDCSRG